MANAKAPDRLETFLADVRSHLKGLPPGEVDEILMELRSHVLDYVGDDRSDGRIAQALDKLGTPKEIARENMIMRVAEASMENRGPMSAMRSIARLARLSLHGLVALSVSILGYGFAASWLIAASVKPFAPDRVGLWILPDESGDLNISLGVVAGHAIGRDILGWSIIPIGIVLGFFFAYLTYRYDLSAIRRIAQSRQYTGEFPT